MFFWNSLAFSKIQWMLEICSLISLTFLNLAGMSGSSWFTYCWNLAWRILSITLLACEISSIVWLFEHSLALPFFGIGMFQALGKVFCFVIFLKSFWGSVQNWGKVQRFPIYTLPHTFIASPIIKTLTSTIHLLQLVSLHWHIIITRNQ